MHRPPSITNGLASRIQDSDCTRPHGTKIDLRKGKWNVSSVSRCGWIRSCSVFPYPFLQIRVVVQQTLRQIHLSWIRTVSRRERLWNFPSGSRPSSSSLRRALSFIVILIAAIRCQHWKAKSLLTRSARKRSPRNPRYFNQVGKAISLTSFR